jgi:hypothetical protein
MAKVEAVVIASEFLMAMEKVALALPEALSVT